MEMMLFEQLMSRMAMNRNKQGIVGGYMKRHLETLDYPDQVGAVLSGIAKNQDIP